MVTPQKDKDVELPELEELFLIAMPDTSIIEKYQNALKMAEELLSSSDICDYEKKRLVYALIHQEKEQFSDLTMKANLEQ